MRDEEKKKSWSSRKDGEQQRKKEMPEEKDCECVRERVCVSEKGQMRADQQEKDTKEQQKAKLRMARTLSRDDAANSQGS